MSEFAFIRAIAELESNLIMVNFLFSCVVVAIIMIYMYRKAKAMEAQYFKLMEELEKLNQTYSPINNTDRLAALLARRPGEISITTLRRQILNVTELLEDIQSTLDNTPQSTS